MRVVATIHPSAVLRAPDSEGRRAAYDSLVADLKVVAKVAEEVRR
jgi:DNA polymerase